MPPSFALTVLDRVVPGPWSGGHRGAPEWRLQRTSPDGPRARQFAAMRTATRRHGGIAHSDVVLLLLRGHAPQPLSRLARWIVAREVVSFEWESTTWLPLFQFDLRDMSVRPDVAAVTCELRDVFDDWELMGWFTSPNGWLGYELPVDLRAVQPAAVLEAARADRFVARG